MTMVLAGLLAACQKPEEHRAELYVFGTMVEIVTWGATDSQAESAFSTIDSLFQNLHTELHAWEPGPLVSLNQAIAAGESAEASEHIIELVHRSAELERLSKGRFNPAIGGLIRLWGFHTSVYPIIGPPPSAGEIEALLRQTPSTLDIRIDGATLTTRNSAIQLDFGAVAKGYAVDLAIRALRDLGIENAIVNTGGDLRAIGRHGDRPWRVGIRGVKGDVVGGLPVRDGEAVFTSGVYERFRQDREERYPHILDPFTGWPVDEIAAVTVIADEGLKADAAATALIVAGNQVWEDVARQMELDYVLLIDESGELLMTPAMRQRVELLASDSGKKAKR